MSMLKILNSEDLDSEKRKGLMLRAYAEDKQAYEVVQKIINDVEVNGEDAVFRYTEQFDGVKLKSLLVSDSEIQRAESLLSDDLKKAFRIASENIRDFHEHQKLDIISKKFRIKGTRLGYKFVHVGCAGVYVPGGKASYPSTVLMGVIPAVIAGVDSPIIITPPDKNGGVNPAVLYCAKISGTGRILKAGGAQGIAAAAFGLAGEKTQVIAGPGNRFVTAAKSILAGRGIIRMDSPAGPSEVVVIADESANPKFIASDMLSQAEHGEDSPAILLTNSRALAVKVSEEIEKGISSRPERKEMKSASIMNHSFAVVFTDMDDAFEFSNEYAPEHLEICTEHPEIDFNKITSAGSVFLGHYAPVALGDYFSGTNHILPTGGAAGFYSGLGIEIFMKRITYQYPSKESLSYAREHIVIMSEAEGLDQEHGHSVEVRFEDN